MQLERIKAEIEKGFAAVSQAAGEPISPFSAFPASGPARSGRRPASRNISIWLVDVVSGDAERGARLAKTTHNTITRLERWAKALSLHETKRITAEALDGILTNLENRRL